MKNHRITLEELDRITAQRTAFATFNDLLNARGNYRPSLWTNGDRPECRELALLADAYDAAQEARGDQRRVFRTP